MLSLRWMLDIVTCELGRRNLIDAPPTVFVDFGTIPKRSSDNARIGRL